MSIVDHWLLPDGVEEVLPPEAQKQESVRRRLLDNFHGWGYQLVVPPMVEFLESLLTGTGSDLDLKTFKVTDQVSGRLMGIRADMTPQVARIDAHSFNQQGHVRLCYAGTVLHAKADNMLASRTPISIGAELFGDTGSDGDLEIVCLMIESVAAITGINPHIELGDVGIFRQLVEMADISQVDEEALFDLIQNKALPDLSEMVNGLGIETGLAERIISLATLCGGADVLEKGREVFASYPEILVRLENLQRVADGINSRFEKADIYYDLSELRGYNYHTGIVFAAYIQAEGRRVAKGGRYDDIGEVFGRARGATGFDIDLKALAHIADDNQASKQIVCARTSSKDAVGRWKKICELRAEGYMVIESDIADCRVVDCNLMLIEQNGQWTLKQV